MDSLGPTLSRAANAIAAKVQVTDATAAQSVLAVASLAACSHADVMLPFGQARPLVLFMATVASSGDRKSTADNEALWPIYKREKNLREEYDDAIKVWRTEHAAWAAEKRKIEGAKIDFSERKNLLNSLGDEPPKPLSPFLVTGDLTVEGLTKNWPTCHAALGIFTAEGATFTAGHAMNSDNQIKTAALLSHLWDGKPAKRIRAEDGISILPGRRLAMHVMIQPEAAKAFLSNRALRDQGLLSRILVASPKSLAGTRIYREATEFDNEAIRGYGARILTILEQEPALFPGKRNELDPPPLLLSPEAKLNWQEFHNHVEQQCAGALAPVKDFAVKAAEHAARIAGVITITEDLRAKEIGSAAMSMQSILSIGI